jgi:hypothetical protein
MSFSFKKLFEPKQISSALPDTLFTVDSLPATSILRNGRIKFVNTTLSIQTIKLWAVPGSSAAADSNLLSFNTPISPNSYVEIDLPILKAGDFVQALSSTALTITAHCLDGFLQA